MNCGDERQLLLSRLVDGELDPDQERSVKAHCAECVDCRNVLELFLRNDKMVGDAVANVAFGNRVLDGVLQKLDEETIPAEPARRIEWRIWLPSAAAAVLLAALLFLLVSQRGEMRSLAKALEQDRRDFDAVALTVEKDRERHRELLESLQQQNHELIQARVALSSGDRAVAAYYPDTRRQIRLVAHFADEAKYSSYLVKRRSEGQKDWTVLSQDLVRPEYEDASAVPGQVYVYVFVAVHPDGTTQESLPHRATLPLPGGVDPMKGIRIECLDVGVNSQIARLRMTRYVDGNPRSIDCTVRGSESVGNRDTHPDVGEIDFRTGLTLESLEEGSQPLFIQVVWSQTDPATGLPLVNPDGSPAVKQETKAVAVRQNQSVTFRRPGQETTIILWKGESVVVPAPSADGKP